MVCMLPANTMTAKQMWFSWCIHPQLLSRPSQFLVVAMRLKHAETHQIYEHNLRDTNSYWDPNILDARADFLASNTNRVTHSTSTYHMWVYLKIGYPKSVVYHQFPIKWWYSPCLSVISVPCCPPVATLSQPFGSVDSMGPVVLRVRIQNNYNASLLLSMIWVCLKIVYP